MMIYNPWDVLKIKFFLSAQGCFKVRPGLVISAPSFQIENHHCILCLITTLQEDGWVGDWCIRDLEVTGLGTPSVVRMKFFTIEERLIHGKLGALSLYDQENCEKNIRKVLGFLNEERFQMPWVFHEQPNINSF